MSNDKFRDDLNRVFDQMSGSPSPALRDRVRSAVTPAPQARGPYWIAAVAAAVIAALIVGVLLVANPLRRTTGPVGAGVPSPSTARSTPSPSGPLTISSAAFHDGEVGVVYTPVQMSATGGVVPYTWALVGSQPAGIAIDANGVVRGTPTSPGTGSFTVQVTDSAGTTANTPGSIKVAPQLGAHYMAPCATGNCIAEVTCSGACGKFGYVDGGAPPYSFRVTSGTLPGGPSLSGMTLDGLFNERGTFRFTVTVTDTAGGSASLSPTFNVAPRLYITSSAACTGDFNTGCTARVSYEGGVGTPTASASIYVCDYGCDPHQPGALPPGFSATVQGGYVVITFPSGMVAGWKGSIVVQIADQYASNAMQMSQMNVNVLPKQ